jgi:hypothetical protein
MNRFLFYIALLLIVLVFAFSCKKVSNNKLDGKWELSSATITSQQITGETINNSQSSSFVFANEQANSTIATNGISSQHVYPFKETMTFDRKSGKYFRDRNYSISDTSFIIAFNSNDPEEKELMQIVKSDYAISESGIFSITGNTGEVKKNSQLVMILQDEKTFLSITRSYYLKISGGNYLPTEFDIAGWSDDNGELSGNQQKESKTSGVSSEGTIFTVEGLKGGIMEILSSSTQETVDFSGNKITISKTQRLIYSKYRSF